MRTVVLVAASAALLSACEPLSMAALGVGGSAAVNHRVGNVGTRTFTASLPRVKTASLGALRRMGVQADASKKTHTGELITARAGNREIEVELESLTANTTRMRVVARESGSFFYDGSTAAEIIVQTEKNLAERGRST
ncbi:MAG: DUF3568 family protein [Betaproteobacteria bacterium]